MESKTPKYSDDSIQVQSTNMLSVQSKLNPTKVSAIMDSLARNYNRPYAAVVREYVSNGIDSHRLAKQTKPVIVTLPNLLQPNLIIQDFGTGMSFEDICNNYVDYLKGSKENEVDQIGFFGIGAKSGFAICDQFVVTSIKDGLKNVVIASKNLEGTKYDFAIKNQKTTEPNGVKVNIPIREDQIVNYTSKYYSNYISLIGWSTDDVIVISDEEEISNLWNERIPGSKNYEDKGDFYLYVGKDTYSINHKGFILGGVYYPRSNWREFNSNKLVNDRIIYKFDITDLYPEDSRESIRDSIKNKESVAKKVQSVEEKIHNEVTELVSKEKTREEKFKKLAEFKNLYIGSVTIDDEKLALATKVNICKAWSEKVVSAYSNVSGTSNINVAKYDGEESVSPTVISNFIEDFSDDDIPDDFTELKEIVSLVKDSTVSVCFFDEDESIVKSSTIGTVRNGSKIKKQIASMRRDRQRSIKTDEFGKISEDATIYTIVPGGWKPKAVYLRELDKTKPIILMDKKSSIYSSSIFNVISAHNDRVSSRTVLTNTLSDRIIAINPTSKESDLLEYKYELKTLKEDERILLDVFMYVFHDALKNDTYYSLPTIGHFRRIIENKKNKVSRVRINFKYHESLLSDDQKKKVDKMMLENTEIRLFFELIKNSALRTECVLINNSDFDCFVEKIIKLIK